MSCTSMKWAIFGFVLIFSALPSDGQTRNTSDCQALQKPNASRISNTEEEKPVALWEGIVLILGFGVFAALVAHFFSWVRRDFYKDEDNLDTSFDAGGNVSIGLTATTIVSQWTWAATLLQSSNVGTKYGISGPFWYASGATVQILLFAMLSIQLKIKSPGAKTFLQVVRARFGRNTHLVLCVFAFLCNVVVTAMLMLGGIAVMTSLVEDLSIEMASMIIALVIGSYTFIGGLGATFYVSYFNTALIFVIMLCFVVKVYTDPNQDDNGNRLGSIKSVHELLSCFQGPDGNHDNSYLTILSSGGLMFGIINLIGNFGTVFVDQAYWQSSVAAKPRQGVWGFLSGGLCWFAVPFCMATTMSLAYLSLSASEGDQLLTVQERDQGLVPPFVATTLMGQAGSFLILLMILMAVTSTGSAEVIAVASILVYDIYQNYIRPFNSGVDSYQSCILCKNFKAQDTSAAAGKEVCKCCPVSQCAKCRKDDLDRAKSCSVKSPFNCPTHGTLRAYGELLLAYKNWAIVWITLATIPLTLVLSALSVSLGWVYLFMGILIGPAVIPIALVVFWDRLSSHGVIAGSLVGVVCGFVTWLSVASTYPHGLSGGFFLENTGRELPMLCGNCVSILVGGLVCVVVSLWKNRYMTREEREEVWEKTRGIDNELSPWAESYAREFNLSDPSKRPSMKEVNSMFRTTKMIAYVGGAVLALILFVLWPALMAAVKSMDLSNFTAWVFVSMIWAYAAAAFLIIVPPVQEVLSAITVKKRRDLEMSQPDRQQSSLGVYAQEQPVVNETKI